MSLYRIGSFNCKNFIYDNNPEKFNWITEIIKQTNTDMFLLQEFAEKLGVRPPFNTVGFIKNFMKEETLVEVEWAEKSKLDHLEKNGCIDGDFRELE